MRVIPLAIKTVIILLCMMNPVYAIEASTEPILCVDAGDHTAKMTRISTNDGGRYLITASEDKTAKVWDVRNGRLLSTLRIPVSSGNDGKLYAVALSPDGRTVALGGWTQAGENNFSIFILDRASGRILQRIADLPNVIFQLAFSPDGKSLAATLAAGSGLRLFSVSDGRLIAEDKSYGNTSYGVHFSNDGRLVTTSDDGYLRLYRFDGVALTQLDKRNAPGGKRPYTARFSPDGKSIAVGFYDTPAVNVLNADQLSLDYAPDTTGVSAALTEIAWSHDGATLYAAGMAGSPVKYIRRWPNSGRGTAQNWSVAGNSSVIGLAALSDGKLVFGDEGLNWGLVDQSGKRTVFHAPVTTDFRDNFNGFSLSADGAMVRFGYAYGGKTPAIFNTRSRSFVSPGLAGLIPPQLHAPDMNVTDWQNNSTPRLNGMALNLKPYEMSHSLALAGDGFILGADSTLRSFDRAGKRRWERTSPGVVWAVNVSRDGRWVVAAYSDGTIRWHRAADGVEQLALFPHADRKRWIMWTPSGYYDASAGGDDLIGWQLNQGKGQATNFFSISRFRGHFHRPDVLAQVFSTQDEGEALRLANLAVGRNTETTSIVQMLPPVVEILAPDDGASVVTSSLALKYLLHTQDDAPVTGIHVRLNGQEVSHWDMRNLSDAAGVREIIFLVPPQDSEIQLFVENKHSISSPAILRVIWAGKNLAAK